MTGNQMTTIQDFTEDGKYGSYPQYESTEHPWLTLPDHWEVRRLKYCAQINPSKTEVEELDSETEATFLPMENVSEQGEIDYGESEQIEEVIDGYTYFRDGDVLVAKITPCFENGKGALAENLKNGIGFGTTEFVVLRPNEDLDERFLYYVTASRLFRKIGEGEMKGAAGQKRVPERFFQNFPQFLPPKEEQNAIADFLDEELSKIKELIHLKEKLIQLVREREEAIITQATTSGLKNNVVTQEAKDETINELPIDWEESTLGKITKKLTNGYVGPTRDILRDDGVPYIQSMHINNGELEFNGEFFVSEEWSKDHRTSILREGDVLIVQTGVDTGESAIVREDLDGANCHALIIARPVEEINSRYLNLFLGSRLGQNLLERIQTGATVEHLNTTRVKDVTIPVPPEDEQREIAEYLETKRQEFNSTVDLINQGIERLKEYRTALVTEAVTGQIDVRGEV